MTTSIAAAAAADFLNFDGLEAITYIARRTDARGDVRETKIDIAYALQRAIGFRDKQLGIVSMDDVGTVWHFRKQDLIDPVSSAVLIPQRGDTIVAVQSVGTDPAGDRWGVRSMDLQTLRTRWRCVCVLGDL